MGGSEDGVIGGESSLEPRGDCGGVRMGGVSLLRGAAPLVVLLELSGSECSR